MSLHAVLAELREFDTALLANTIDYIDPTPKHELYMGGSIRSVTPSLGPTVGVAVTCELDSSTPGGESAVDPFWRQLDQMAADDLPKVWVVKIKGARPDHECVIGDGMAKLLYSVGCVGLVTNGGVRDVQGLLATPLAAYCSGTTIHHGVLRFSAPGEPVDVGGLLIRSGDIIHANAEGVIRVPRACLADLPSRAVKMRAAEHDIHRIWRRRDVSLSDKRKRAVEVFSEYGFTQAAFGRGHELR